MPRCRASTYYKARKMTPDYLLTKMMLSQRWLTSRWYDGDAADDGKNPGVSAKEDHDATTMPENLSCKTYDLQFPSPSAPRVHVVNKHDLRTQRYPLLRNVVIFETNLAPCAQLLFSSNASACSVGLEKNLILHLSYMLLVHHMA